MCRRRSRPVIARMHVVTCSRCLTRDVRQRELHRTRDVPMRNGGKVRGHDDQPFRACVVHARACSSSPVSLTRPDRIRMGALNCWGASR